MRNQTGRFVISAGRAILSVALSAGALLFQGCTPSLEPTASGAGDDFPNAKVTVGDLISNSMSVTSEWESLSAVPDSVDPAIFSADTLLASVGTDTTKGLKKSAAGGIVADSVYWDYSDTLRGFASCYYVKKGLFSVTEVTSVVHFNERAKDSILGNESIIHTQGIITNVISRIVTTYDIRDADSNGYLDTAYIIQATPETGRTRYNAAFGSWGNRTGIEDAGHIRMSCLELFYVVGTGDTTTFFQLRDRDGDGRIYVQGQAVNRIRFVYAFKDPFALLPRKPVAGILALDGGLAPGSTSRFTADRLGAQYLYRDGTSDRILITGAHRDSLLSGHDTLTLALLRSTPERLLFDSLSVQLVLAPDGTSARYGLARLSIIARVNGTNLRELRCSFVPDAPMLHGQLLKFTSGGFDATVIYPKGTQGTLKGRLSQGVYSLRYTAPDGSAQDVSFSQTGEVVQ